MPTTLRNTDILFNDGTTQSSAASPLPSLASDVNTSTNLTLTSSSRPYQNVCFTTTGNYINLPDATTLNTITPFRFVINNYGSLGWGVKTASGDIIKGLSTSNISLTLMDNSTARGIWESQSSPIFPYSTFNNPVNTSTIYVARLLQTGSGFGAYYVDAVPIATDKALVFYSANPAGTTTDMVGYSSAPNIDIWGVVATVSGTGASTSISWGTPVRIFNNLQGTQLSCAGFGNGQAIFMRANQAWGISVSGTTISVGGATTVPVSGSNITYATTANTIIWYALGTTSIPACVVQVSGTTITASGSSTNVVSGGSANGACGGFIGNAGSDTFIAGMTPEIAGNNSIYHRAFTISGTTISLGATQTQTVYSGTNGLVPGSSVGCAWSPTAGTVVINNSSTSAALTYSGTTFSSIVFPIGGAFSGSQYSQQNASRQNAYNQSSLTTNHWIIPTNQSSFVIRQFYNNTIYDYTTFGSNFSAPNYYTAGGSGSSYSGAAPWAGGQCVLPNGTIFLAGVNGTSSTTSFLSAQTVSVYK